MGMWKPHVYCNIIEDIKYGRNYLPYYAQQRWHPLKNNKHWTSCETQGEKKVVSNFSVFSKFNLVPIYRKFYNMVKNS